MTTTQPYESGTIDDVVYGPSRGWLSGWHGVLPFNDEPVEVKLWTVERDLDDYPWKRLNADVEIDVVYEGALLFLVRADADSPIERVTVSAGQWIAFHHGALLKTCSVVIPSRGMTVRWPSSASAKEAIE